MKKIRRVVPVLLFVFAVFHFSGIILLHNPEIDGSEREATLRLLARIARQNHKHEPVGAFLETDNRTDISSLSLFDSGNPSPCEDSTQLLVTVFSKASEFETRQEIRETWASRENFNASFTRVLFVTAKDDKNSSTIRPESDVIEVNYGEGYYNLSMKTFTALTFHRDHCPKTKCLLKIDSDVIANLMGIEDLCKSTSDAPKISGFSSLQWVTVNREKSSKFYVPSFIYAHDFYPPYSEGPAYMLSGPNTSALLLAALEETPFLKSENFRRLPEDVIFTGIVRALAKVETQFVGGFSMRKTGRFLYWCEPEKSPNPLVYHGASSISQYWKILQEKRVNALAFGWFKRFIACGFNDELPVPI